MSENNFWAGAEIIISYTYQDAISDGQLVEIIKNRWPELTKGKPILATVTLYSAMSLAALQEIWN